MKKIFILYLLMLFSISGKAQDVIKLTNKTQLKTKVLEVKENTITYKRFVNIEGPTYTISKNKVYQIIYKNGLVKTYTTTAKNTPLENTPPNINLKKPTFITYTDAELEKEKQKMYAEKLTQTLPDTSLNKYALIKVPNVFMYNQHNKKVRLADYINSNTSLANKPTLIITWAWRWCWPCVKMIDTLLEHYDKNKFNLVIINKVEKTVTSSAKIISNAEANLKNNNRSYYLNQTTALYDIENNLERYDKNTAPLLIWADKDLNITSTFNGFEISYQQIMDVFDYSPTSFYNNNFYSYFTNGYPVNANVAEYRINRERIGNIIKLTKVANENVRAIQNATYFFKEDEFNNVEPLK